MILRWFATVASEAALGAGAATLSPTGKLIFQLAWYATGAAVLAATGQVRMAPIFTAAAIASTILAIIWHQ